MQLEEQRGIIERVGTQRDEFMRDLEKRKQENANLNVVHAKTLAELDHNINIVSKLNKKLSTLNLEMRVRNFFIVHYLKLKSKKNKLYKILQLT